MLENIPDELRARRQWVVASGVTLPDGKIDKRPLCPRTGLAASCDDPSTWGTWEEAEASPHRFKGFMLTDDDPYTVIDMDPTDDPVLLERHAQVYEMFLTYAEFSQSGRGAHLVFRAKLSGGNIQNARNKIEVYSRGHYIICTGQVLRTIAIADCQDLLDRLVATLKQGEPRSIVLEQIDSDIVDDEVMRIGWNAANGEKFRMLFEGRWSERPDLYPSQSEADHAMLGMFSFYSFDNAQCCRLFRKSALNRDKATDAYLHRMLAKFRGQQADQKATVAELLANLPDVTTVKAEVGGMTAADFPEGLVGDIARYILDSAIRPVPEIALAAGLALMAGIGGRAYNISNSGLNLYVALIAGTGTGKEGAARGITTLLQAVRNEKLVAAAIDFRGPAVFASGPALVKVLGKRPCFVSVLGEFGLFLKRLCSAKANSNDLTLKTMFLSLFNMSGKNDTLFGSVYSDEDKNTANVQSPNVSILGESTQERFYDALGASAVLDGTLPRFLIIEYTGKRPARNKRAFFAPPDDLLEKLAKFCAFCLTAAKESKTNIVATSEDADVVFELFDSEADTPMNSGSPAEVEMWSRAHIKALKIAALLAVGRDPDNPEINVTEAQWACKMVKADIARLTARFLDGDIGNGDMKREAEVRRLIGTWFKLSKTEKKKYRATDKMTELGGIPYFYLRKARLLAAFNDHHLDSTRLLANTLESLVKAQEVELVEPLTARATFETRATIYVVGQNFPK